MKVGLVAVHYPRREHWDEMISRVHQAAEVLAATPGCLAAVAADAGAACDRPVIAGLMRAVVSPPRCGQIQFSGGDSGEALSHIDQREASLGAPVVLGVSDP